MSTQLPFVKDSIPPPPCRFRIVLNGFTTASISRMRAWLITIPGMRPPSVKSSTHAHCPSSGPTALEAPAPAAESTSMFMATGNMWSNAAVLGRSGNFGREERMGRSEVGGGRTYVLSGRRERVTRAVPGGGVCEAKMDRR